MRYFQQEGFGPMITKQNLSFENTPYMELVVVGKCFLRFFHRSLSASTAMILSASLHVLKKRVRVNYWPMLVKQGG